MKNVVKEQRQFIAEAIKEYRKQRDQARIDGDNATANTKQALAKNMLVMSRVFKKAIVRRYHLTVHVN